jgi:hypothetical protein
VVGRFVLSLNTAMICSSVNRPSSYSSPLPALYPEKLISRLIASRTSAPTSLRPCSTADLADADSTYCFFVSPLYVVPKRVCLRRIMRRRCSINGKIGRASTPLDLMTCGSEDEQASIFFVQESPRQAILTVFNWTKTSGTSRCGVRNLWRAVRVQ